MQKIWNLAVFKNDVRVGLETFTWELEAVSRVYYWTAVYRALDTVTVKTQDVGVEIVSCHIDRPQRIAILLYTQEV